MYEQKFNTIFAKRLRYYLKKCNMTQLDLAKQLGVGTTSVYNWCNGIKTPRMDKVDTMCSIFHCRHADLMEEKPDDLCRDEFPPEIYAAAHDMMELSETDKKTAIDMIHFLYERGKKTT